MEPRAGEKSATMADKIGLSEAAQTLADHFGSQLETGRDEGRRLMASALHERFGIANREARRLIDGLEHAASIRWIEGHTSTAQAPVIPGDVGYWQLQPA
jgi:hypothetical protein